MVYAPLEAHHKVALRVDAHITSTRSFKDVTELSTYAIAMSNFQDCQFRSIGQHCNIEPGRTTVTFSCASNGAYTIQNDRLFLKLAFIVYTI